MNPNDSNNKNAEVIITEIIHGQGEEVLKGSLVLIHYTGTLEDGSVFDSTAKHGRAFQFVVGSQKIIKGMSLGILGMRVGGKRKIFIPSELAYGEREMGPLIKAQSNLIFEMELLESRARE